MPGRSATPQRLRGREATPNSAVSRYRSYIAAHATLLYSRATANRPFRGRTYEHPLKRNDHGVISAMQAHEFTLYDMLSRNALIYDDRPAVIHAQGRLTFRDFLARVDALAAGLAALPLVKGERLCILAQNHPAYLELYGACARLGVMAYPINWRLTAEEIGRIVERAAPRLLLVDDSALPLVADWPRTRADIASWYTLGSTDVPGFIPFETLYHASGELVPYAVAPDDPFVVISTAAVDIVPRGAVLTHTNFLMANLQTMACMGLTEADANLLALPLFHVAALGTALATMHAGGRQGGRGAAGGGDGVKRGFIFPILRL
jgi:acyl-CoA synthetase (AMP-forming)/AMP-acid ligase II